VAGVGSAIASDGMEERLGDSSSSKNGDERGRGRHFGVGTELPELHGFGFGIVSSALVLHSSRVAFVSSCSYSRAWGYLAWPMRSAR
jgi:hypothetical protein